MRMQWNDSLLLGIKECDNDHKELVSEFDQLTELVKQHGDLEKVESYLHLIEKYLTDHCLREEAFQKSINYPEYDQHRQAHHDLKELYHKLHDNYTTAFSTNEDLLRLILMMKDWLFHHILTEDKKLADYMKRQGML